MSTDPGYHDNLCALACENDVFRRVLFTTKRSQLVVMALEPGEDIGSEVHAHTDQVFVIVMGAGIVVLDGKRAPLCGGDVVVVPAGVEHNVINKGSEPMKLLTIYTPPNHLPGRLHATKGEAIADVEDAAVEHAAAEQRR